MRGSLSPEVEIMCARADCMPLAPQKAIQILAPRCQTGGSVSRGLRTRTLRISTPLQLTTPGLRCAYLVPHFLSGAATGTGNRLQCIWHLEARRRGKTSICCLSKPLRLHFADRRRVVRTGITVGTHVDSGQEWAALPS